jgi:hypothetical protein
VPAWRYLAHSTSIGTIGDNVGKTPKMVACHRENRCIAVNPSANILFVQVGWESRKAILQDPPSRDLSSDETLRLLPLGDVSHSVRSCATALFGACRNPGRSDREPWGPGLFHVWTTILDTEAARRHRGKPVENAKTSSHSKRLAVDTPLH